MVMQHLLYLHGFLSDENSIKGQFVKARMAEDWPQVKVHCMTYPIGQPKVSVGYIQNYIEYKLLSNSSNDKNLQWWVMGSSMGGYFAQYIAQVYQVPYIMINPALDPVATLSAFMGQHQHPRTQEKFTIDEDYLEQLAAYQVNLKAKERALLLLDRGDEIIDYRHALDKYQDRCKTLVYERGDHAFQHMKAAWPQILAFLKSSS